MTRRGYLERIAAMLLVACLLLPTGVGATVTDTRAGSLTEAGPRAVDDGDYDASQLNESVLNDPPETAGEFLTAFRDLNGSTSFLEYSELEVIRSQAITEVQVGTFSAEKQTRIALLYEVLWTFNRSYEAAENDNVSVALQWANETGAAIESLRDEGDTEYAALSDLALERFYRNVGDQYFDQARTTERTPTEIRALTAAATSYRRAGAVEDYSQVSVRLDAVRTRYRSDLQTLNSSVAAGSDYFEGCNGCSSLGASIASGPAAFGEYRTASTARSRVIHAETLAQQHGLESRQESIEAIRSDMTTAVIALGIASSIWALAYVAIVAGLTAIVLRQLLAWERDVEASRRVELLLQGDVS